MSTANHRRRMWNFLTLPPFGRSHVFNANAALNFTSILNSIGIVEKWSVNRGILFQNFYLVSLKIKFYISSLSKIATKLQSNQSPLIVSLIRRWRRFYFFELLFRAIFHSRPRWLNSEYLFITIFRKFSISIICA